MTKSQYQFTPNEQDYDAGVIQDLIFQNIAKRVWVYVDHVSGHVQIDDAVYGANNIMTPTEQATMRSLLQGLPVYVSG